MASVSRLTDLWPPNSLNVLKILNANNKEDRNNTVFPAVS